MPVMHSAAGSMAQPRRIADSIEAQSHEAQGDTTGKAKGREMFCKHRSMVHLKASGQWQPSGTATGQAIEAEPVIWLQCATNKHQQHLDNARVSCYRTVGEEDQRVQLYR